MNLSEAEFPQGGFTIRECQIPKGVPTESSIPWGGDPYESRTRVCGVRGRRLDHLTNGPDNNAVTMHTGVKQHSRQHGKDKPNN